MSDNASGSSMNEVKGEIKVGDRIQSNSCGMYTVLEKNGGKYAVQFDTGNIVIALKAAVINGMIKDNLFPTVFGVGYIGIGNYASRAGGSILQEYRAWSGMLSRCYYAKDAHRASGVGPYDNVNIDEHWLNFQNFAAWYNPRRNTLNSGGIIRPALDKEILAVKDTPKLYGPDTCCVVPSEINGALIDIDHEQGCILKCGLGYFVKQKNRKATKHFETIEEAMFARKALKQEQLMGLAEKYNHVLEPKVYDRLSNWYEV